MSAEIIKPVFGVGGEFSRRRVLDRPLRSVFCRRAALLRTVFRMEADNIYFIGDFVQLPERKIRSYAPRKEYADTMIDNIERRGLTTGMVVRGWKRPSTLGMM